MIKPELPLFGKHNEPFSLIRDEAVDGERIQREKEAKAKAAADADKHQLKLKETTT